jgi:hypothetical protein
MGGDNSHVAFGQKLPGGGKKYEIVHCCYATTSSIIAKVRAKSSQVFMQLP